MTFNHYYVKRSPQKAKENCHQEHLQNSQLSGSLILEGDRRISAANEENTESVGLNSKSIETPCWFETSSKSVDHRLSTCDLGLG